MVVVDTSAWVNFLKRPETLAGREVVSLLQANDVVMLGQVLAEVLQGMPAEEFAPMRSRLESLPYQEASKSTWSAAAELAVQLRHQGMMTPLSDLLIATQALEGKHELFSLDSHFKRVPGLRLHEIASA